jgi:soluble lytic murein transglycosylase-like protein
MPQHSSVTAVLRWQDLILRAATEYDLDPFVVAGVVAQESAGPYVLPDGSANPYAIRVERGFWSRYYDGIKAFVTKSASRRDDRWFAYPDIYSASYGLMQVLYQTARERGFDPIFPTELCDPLTGLRAGCAHLRWCLKQEGQDVSRALRRYNGGADYPPKILAHVEAIRAGGVFHAWRQGTNSG